MTPPDRNDQTTSHAATAPAIVVASGTLSSRSLRLSQHGAEPDDRRHERRAEPGGLRRELLPPVVVDAPRPLADAAARLAPRCARSMPRSASVSGSAISRVSANVPPAPPARRRRATQAFDEAQQRHPWSDEEPVGQQLILQPDEPGQRPARAVVARVEGASVPAVVRAVEVEQQHAVGIDLGACTRADAPSTSKIFHRSRPSHASRSARRRANVTRTVTGKTPSP